MTTFKGNDLRWPPLVHDIIYGKVDGVFHEDSKHFNEQLKGRSIDAEWLNMHFSAGHVNDDSAHGRGRWKVCSPHGFTSHKVGYEKRRGKVVLVHIYCTVTKSRRNRYMMGKYASVGNPSGGAGGKRKKPVVGDDGWTTMK